MDTAATTPGLACVMRPQLELVVDAGERQRLQELHRYHVLDTAPEPCYDEIAQLAAHICQVPVALVVFVDACRLFLKARLGMEGVTEIPIVDREQLFCVHAIMDDALLVIPDALEDARFRCNPMVVNDPKIRFYAGAPLVTPGGHRLGNLCVIDMVPRHLDAQQKRSLEQLSRQVSAQLELRLSLAAVCQQNRQLEQLSAEKSRFLSAVSHDIRQPLATVMMCSELMLNDDEQLLAEPHVELANAAFSCAQFMHNLVDELLQMGESDFGNVPVPLDSRMTDLVALVHRVVATNALYARPKHITLHLAIEAGGTGGSGGDSGSGGGGGGLCGSPVSRGTGLGVLVLATPPGATGGDGTRELLSYDQWHASRTGARGKINLLIDPMKIEQALNNLLSNAVKFSHPHSSIDVVIGRVDMGGVEGSRVQGRCASVSVIDRGQGIPSEEMGKLFQPFQRLSVKPTGGETSTGLGLAITRNIVLAHAGDVQVESEQGLGSTFRMLLPLPTRSDLIEPLAGNAAAQQQSRPSAHTQAQGIRRPMAKAGYKVLVADDNAINLSLMTRILQRHGHSVWTACDGDEALELFHEMGGHDHFHVLLIDEEMPRMCGMELIGHIRKLEAEREVDRAARLPRMPLVSVSGHADSEHKRTIQAAGADDVCPKPFNAERLLEIVARLGAHHHRQRQEKRQALLPLSAAAAAAAAAAGPDLGT